MKTAENQYAKFRTLIARQKQIADQRQRLEVKKNNLEQEIRILEDSAEKAKLKFAADEKKHIRDEINSKELATSKATSDNLSQKLTDVKRLWELTVDALMDISAESDSVSREISGTLKIYTNFIKNDLAAELGEDAKIREKILETYAALTIADAWNINWSGFLASIFPSPSNEEVKKAVADFRAKRKL